jgi:hypothetical protein
MAARVSYDRVGDVLRIDLVEPYETQESDMVSDTVLVRTNPASGRVESIEVLFFLRDAQHHPVAIPVTPGLELDETAVTTVEPPLPVH